MTTIAFIGLGIMGSPMAQHLARAGHDVVGFDATPEKAKPLIDAGGRAADSGTDAVRGAEVVAGCVALPERRRSWAGFANQLRTTRGSRSSHSMGTGSSGT